MYNGGTYCFSLDVRCTFPMSRLCELPSTSTLFREWYCRGFGLPSSIMSDRDKRFTSRLFTLFTRLVDCKVLLRSEGISCPANVQRPSKLLPDWLGRFKVVVLMEPLGVNLSWNSRLPCRVFIQYSMPIDSAHITTNMSVFSSRPRYY